MSGFEEKIKQEAKTGNAIITTSWHDFDESNAFMKSSSEEREEAQRKFREWLSEVWVPLDDVLGLHAEDQKKRDDFDKALIRTHELRDRRDEERKQKLQPILESYRNMFIARITDSSWSTLEEAPQCDGYVCRVVLPEWACEWMDKIIEFEEVLKE